MTKKTIISYVFIVLAATFWGTTGTANRYLAPANLDQIQILFLRVFLAVIFLGAYLLVTDRKAFKIRLKDIWVFIGTGICSVLLFGFSYFTAMQEMTLSMAVVLLYTSPIFVVILSAILFRERITVPKIIALILIILGALCTTGLISGGIATTGRGLLFGFMSGLGYGLYSIFSRFGINRGYQSYTITFYTMVFASIGCALFTDFSTLLPRACSTGSSVFWVLWMGLVTCTLPYIFYTKGLEGVDNGPASITASWEIVTATLCSTIIFHEPFTFTNLLGVVFVLVGIVFMNLTLNRKSGNND